MAKKREFYFDSSDGVNHVHALEWLPESGEARAVVQIVHGVAEYAARYDRFADWLTEQGFCVVANDHLGHGLTAASDAELGFTAPKDGWELMVKDVERLREQTAAAYAGKPYFLLGHSMGSFLARTYLIRFPGRVTGCILSGTGQNSPFQLTVGEIICRKELKRLGDHGRSPRIQKMSFGSYNKYIKPQRTEYDWISRDNAVVDAYCADPRCGFPATVTLFGDMLYGLHLIADAGELKKMDLSTPLLLVSGAMDPVGSYGKGVRTVEKYLRDAGCADVTVKLYPDDRHEILNELNRLDVYADLLAWMKAHTPAAEPAGAL